MVQALNNISPYCERCDRETDHLISTLGPGLQPRLVCWECLDRQEKRDNLRPGWRRPRPV